MKKKQLVFVMMFVASVMASGCGMRENATTELATSSNAVSKPLLDENFKNHYNEVQIGDSKVSFPCDLETLEKLGFTCESEELINKGTPSYLTLSKDGSTIKVHAANNQSDAVPVSEAEIVSLLATREDSEALGLSFYGGITFESTENEVKAVLGQMEAYDDGVLYRIKMGDYSYFSVSFHSGKIHDIMIIDGEKYF